MRFLSLTLAAVVLIATAAPFPAAAQNVDQLMRSYYGFTRPSSIKESDKTVGTTPVQLLDHNPTRFEDIISVTGANACSIGRTAAVTTTTGIYLAASGGSYAEDWVDDGYLPEYEMWAICAAGGTTIHVTEERFQ